MRLISLTANKETFRPVTFNEKGLSLVVGAQKDVANKSSDRTYNGVGKSLLVAIIHFCLGSNKVVEFEKKIPGWQFVLRFKHGKKVYRAARDTSKQGIVKLDDEELSLADYKAKLTPLAFALPEPIPSLTFRSLIGHFVRPRKASYLSYDQVDAKESPYDKLLRNAFLLGLDISIVRKKHDLRVEKEEIREMKESLTKDVVFKEYFTGNKNPDIELRDLEQKLSSLKRSLAEFRVAENYYEKQREANDTQKSVQYIRNQIVAIRSAVENITASLAIRPDLDPAQVVAVYKEAKTELSDQIVKRLDEVKDFHNRLIVNREKRLTAEKGKLEAEIKDLEGRLASESSKLNNVTHFLGTHGAFDEFVAMTDELARVESSAQKLRDYKGLIATYSNKSSEITAALSRETIRANEYIQKSKSLLDSNLDRFRSLSSRFYGERPGGLIIVNNEGDNQTRFDIQAHIEDDAADGINEVKIFCYDMTILLQRHNHSVDFVFHDSRLFSDIDKRQRATAFKVVDDETSAHGLQYIATLNQDQIDSMKDEFSAEQFKKLFGEPILRLTDESPSGRLLGIQVDMSYEE